jgi:hypothetical protein
LDPKYNPLDQNIITRQGWTKTTRINQDYHSISLGHAPYERLPKMHTNVVRQSRQPVTNFGITTSTK